MSGIQPNDRALQIGPWRTLNRESQTYEVALDELNSMQNMRIGLRGELIVRKGIEDYEVSFGGTTVNGLWRYGKTNGDTEVVAFSNGNIYADDGTGTFASIVAQTASADGYIWFSQWSDTVFAPSDAADNKVYYRGASTESRTSDIQPTYVPELQGSFIAGGDLAPSTDYVYRYTFTYSMNGVDFLSESHPIYSGGTTYGQLNITTGAGANLTYEISKAAPGTDTFPDNVLQMNIYRQDGGLGIQGTRLAAAGEYSDWKDPALWYVGSITKTDYDAAVTNDVLFTDDNVVTFPDFDRQINYFGLDKPPRARFCVPHKTRMWYLRAPANPNYAYFSQYREPEKVYADDFRVIGHDGEPIMGGLSFRNRFLLIPKTHSLHGIYGGDLEVLPGIPDFSIDVISPDVGCIAPATLVTAEDHAMWLSHRGLEVFDGTTPRLIDSDLIKPVLRVIPDARKYYACGGYYSKERQYWLAVTPVGGSGNTEVYIYDFKIRGWMGPHIYRDTSQDVPYNLFVEFRRGDEAGTFLGGTNLNPTGSGFHKLDDEDDDLPATTTIAWNAISGSADFGENVVEFTGIQVELTTSVTTTVTWAIDDDATLTGNYTISSTGDEQQLHTKELEREGNRIRIKVNGASAVPDQQVKRIIVRYRPTGRVKKVN
jgi:hypothetical protein